VLYALTAEIRRRAYSIRTEQAYEHWACRFIAFCRKRDPRELGAAEAGAFLEDLAVRGNVAASTQNQALNALVFLYGQVLKKAARSPRRVRPGQTAAAAARGAHSFQGSSRLRSLGYGANGGLTRSTSILARAPAHAVGRSFDGNVVRSRADDVAGRVDVVPHGDPSFPRADPSFPHVDTSFPSVPTTYPSVPTMIRGAPNVSRWGRKHPAPSFHRIPRTVTHRRFLISSSWPPPVSPVHASRRERGC
jgi:hypothetical protein